MECLEFRVEFSVCRQNDCSTNESLFSFLQTAGAAVGAAISRPSKIVAWLGFSGVCAGAALRAADSRPYGRRWHFAPRYSRFYWDINHCTLNSPHDILIPKLWISKRREGGSVEC